MRVAVRIEASPYRRASMAASPDRGRERVRRPRHVGRRAFLLSALSALPALPILALPARPAIAAADPARFVDDLGAQTIAIIKSSSVGLPERQRRFRALFLQAFDAPTIGRFVLGRYWEKTSDGEKASYLKLFGDYVAAIYAVQFSHYQGESFKTVGVDPIGEGDSAVRAEIAQPGKAPITLTFRARPEGGGFKIVDVTVEGVSLIVTKRSEFASVLGREGLNGVMTRMQQVVNETQTAGS